METSQGTMRQHPYGQPSYIELDGDVVLIDGRPRFGLRQLTYREDYIKMRPETKLRTAFVDFENQFGLILDWSSDVDRMDATEPWSERASDVLLSIIDNGMKDLNRWQVAEFAYAYVADLEVVIRAVSSWPTGKPDLDGLFAKLAEHLANGPEGDTYSKARIEDLSHLGIDDPITQALVEIVKARGDEDPVDRSAR